MKRIVFSFIFLLIGLFLSVTQLNAQTTITGITATESRCTASGTLTVTATDGVPPYQYAITAGPVTAPNQSSNILAALSPGTYTIRVSDNIGSTAIKTATVPGTYSLLNPSTALTKPYCPGSNDGKIQVTIPPSSGRAPYSFQLVSASPVTTGIITPGTNAYTFTGLAAGTYRYQVSDSCGNVQTRNVVITDPTPGALAVCGSANTPYWSFVKNVCDSVDITICISGGTPGYKLQVYLNGNTSPATRMTKYFTVADGIQNVLRVPYTTVVNGTHSYTLTDSCGQSVSGTFKTESMTAKATSSPTTCNNQDIIFTENPSNYPYGFKAPLTFQLLQGATVIGTQVNNNLFTNIPVTLPTAFTAQITDVCGYVYTYNFTIFPRAKNVAFSSFIKGSNSLDSTTTLRLIGLQTLNTPTLVKFLSGPVSYSSSLFNYSQTISYPVTDTITSNPSNSPYYQKSNLPKGTYTIQVIDSCGFTQNLTITVGPNDVKSYQYQETVLPGCINANGVKLKANLNGFNTGDQMRLYSLPANTAIGGKIITSIPDSLIVSNLTAGTYLAKYSTESFNNLFGANKIDNNWSPVRDTIIVPAYVQPFVSPATQAVACSGATTGSITVTATGGNNIYTYEIIGGPVTAGPQTSPVFTGLPSPGTYTVKATDGCGNSNTYGVSMASLAPPNITADRACAMLEQNISLTADTIYNATYNWTGPSGFIDSGRSFTLTSYTNLQQGNYIVTTSVPGCSDVSQNYTVNSCVVLPVSLLSFTAQKKQASVLLQWQTTNEINNGYFEIEYSTNGYGWTKIGEVEALDNTDNIKTYSMQYDNILNGMNYYRLKIVSKDGNYNYSSIQTVRFKNDDLITALPNPADDIVVITGAKVNSTLRLADVTGRLLIQKTVTDPIETLQLSQLSSAVYLLQVVENGTVIKTVKLVKK